MTPLSKQPRAWAPVTRWAVPSALLSLCLVVLSLSACGANSGANAPTGSPTSAPARSPTPAPTPFTVTGVDLSVSPASVAGMTCGSSASFTYTAVFHIPAHTAGGVIQFSYTLNNGRSQTDSSMTVGPGETSKTFTFASSGVVSPEHAYPGVAAVMVTSPNEVRSPSAYPSGSCVPPGPFKVTSVTMAVNPTSIAGLSCGTHLTVTYTATFHLAPNGPGGTIKFYYTINNGRGDNPASLTVAPGQTTATYQFTWSGDLPADHTFPEGGGVWVESPNSVLSPLLAPSGQCG